MEKVRLLSSLKLLLVYIASARAFSPVARSEKGQAHRSALCAKMPSRSDFLAVAGSFVTGAIVSSVEPANAANPSSSIYLSEEIKTIDMSLPSYDKINTLTADEKSLGFEDVPEPKKEKGMKKKPKKKEPTSGEDNPMSAFLPSMKKKGPSKAPKPKKEKVVKEKKVKEEAPKVEFETMDMGLPSYSESTGAKEKSVFAL